MNIEALAVEVYGSLHSDDIKFAHLVREAVVQELVGADVEPATVTVLRSIPYYTADQLAGAVLRERERCAKLVEADPSYDWHKFACECAAAIRSGE